MPGARLVFASVVFFLSGASALIFETLWFRQASLTFGSSVWATSLVLSSFMAGLALGSALAARFGARITRPLLGYAALEAVIAAAGVALVLLLPRLTLFLLPLFRPFLDVPLVLQPLRFLVGFAVLLVPAVAMGATLPILVQALRGADPDFGRVLGRLYGWNTLGALAGAATSELVFIPALGITRSGFAAGVLNLVAALLAWRLARRVETLPAAVATAAAEIAQEPRGRAGGLLLAAFLSGGILLALEVVWFRILVLFVPTTSQAFALLLAVVLAGIGLGGLAASGWLRRSPRVERRAAAVALAAAVATVASYAGLGLVVEGVAAPKSTRLPVILAYAGSLMLPTAFFSGALFILLGKRVHAELGVAARATGLLALANTVGATLGPLLAGFVLLPGLGMERCVFALAAAYGAVALAVPARGPRVLASRAGLAGAAAFAAALVLFPFGRMQEVYLGRRLAQLEAQGERVVAVREGLLETLVYTRTDWLGERLFVRLLTNGYSMSATDPASERYMSLFAEIPAALHPAPRDALLISFGVGTTAAALTELASLETIDVVDISPEIVAGAELVFPDPATNPLRDPRVRVHVEDGRYFLHTSRRRYDLVTSEPPPPAFAGIVNLYTQEYFALLRSRLADGGYVSYWLPVVQLADLEARAIVRSFCAVFADCSLWEGTPQNWILLGSRGATGRVPEARLRRLFADPQAGPRLRRVGVEQAEQLGTLLLADAETLEGWTRGVAPLVDDHPERAPRPSRIWRGVPEAYAELLDAKRARARFARSSWVRERWPPRLREATLGFFDLRGLATEHQLRRQAPFRAAGLVRVLRETRLHTLPLWLLGSSPLEQETVERARARGERSSAIDYHLAVRALADRDWALAADRFDALPREPVQAPFQDPAHVLALCLAGRLEAAEKRLRELAREPGWGSRDPAWALWLRERFGLAAPAPVARAR